MAMRRYARVLPHVAWFIWFTTFVVAFPICLTLHLIVPTATADEIAVVVAAPLGLFFLYAHLAAWLLSTSGRRENSEISRTIGFIANVLLLMMFTVPSTLVYWLAGIDWAMHFAFLLSAVCVLGIIVALLLRRLGGGARDLARLALIPAALVATAGSTVVHVSSAVTTVTTIRHRIA